MEKFRKKPVVMEFEDAEKFYVTFNRADEKVQG